jgi:hypothetical protein
MQAAVRRSTYGRLTATALQELYLGLSSVDFSRDIVPGQEAALRVLPVPACGWTDLGTVQRVEKTLKATAPSNASRWPSVQYAGLLSLEQQHYARQSQAAVAHA